MTRNKIKNFDGTITVRFSNDLLKKIDKARGDMTISLFIRSIMEKQLK